MSSSSAERSTNKIRFTWPLSVDLDDPSWPLLEGGIRQGIDLDWTGGLSSQFVTRGLVAQVSGEPDRAKCGSSAADNSWSEQIPVDFFTTPGDAVCIQTREQGWA